MYCKMYTLKYVEIILLHINDSYIAIKFSDMVTTFIEFIEQLVIVQYSQNALLDLAAILNNTSSQHQTQFSQKKINLFQENCLKLVSNSSKLLFYFQDYMQDILNNFCIIYKK